MYWSVYNNKQEETTKCSSSHIRVMKKKVTKNRGNVGKFWKKHQNLLWKVSDLLSIFGEFSELSFYFSRIEEKKKIYFFLEIRGKWKEKSENSGKILTRWGIQWGNFGYLCGILRRYWVFLVNFLVSVYA